MNVNISAIKTIIRDKISAQLFLFVAIICFINLAFSWFVGTFTLVVSLCALSLSTLLLHNVEAKLKVQSVITSALNLGNTKQQPPDDSEKIEVAEELDAALESFFKRIIRNFISSWYSNVTQDETFVWNIKLEITEALRKIAIRLRDVDHSRLISNKLLPVVYSHFEILDRIVQRESSTDEEVAAFVDNENPIHPATFNRNSEINFLRHVSTNLIRILVSEKNFDCKILVNLLKEILTCSVLLPLTDVISDPATLNLLVILATNLRVQKTATKKANGKKVLLLENFVKEFKMNLTDDDDDDDDAGGGQNINRNFLKDQEKLYSFMQYLKSQGNTDIELLKFFLDVEHLNAELEKSYVICDPFKLSELQQKSERLLMFYQGHLFQATEGEEKPDDLLKAHDHARRILEAKWKNEFYRSAEYFQLIYGDKEYSYIPDAAKAADVTDAAFHHHKLSSKLKSVMSIRTGTVEGLEATEIPIWDALDHPLGHSSYYNSVAVKLRKERGQDLDSFMQSFFHSIEQDADVGEDIASTQTQEEANRRQKKKPNHELYKNLFNVTGQSRINQFTSVPCVKSSVDSTIYFLASILNVHRVLLRLFNGVVRMLPDGDNIICELLRKFLFKIIDEPIAAKLINELEEKVFDPNPTNPPSNEELTKRRQLAATRIENVNKNLGKILTFLQNPVLNKHLVYCLIDVIAVEIFPELNLDAKD